MSGGRSMAELARQDHATARRLADELATSVAAHRSLRAEMERAITERAGQSDRERLRALLDAWRRGCEGVDASLARVGIRVEPAAHEGDEADARDAAQRRAS